MGELSLGREVATCTLGPKQRIRAGKFRLLLRLVLILGLSLSLSGCDQEKILGHFFELKGDILETLNHHRKALDAYNRALEYEPDQAGVYAGRGLAHFYLDHLDEAIADYNRALSLNPKLAGTFLNRGYAYKKKGQYDKALADYNRAIELRPNDALFYNNRGEAYRLKLQLDKAMDDYNRALELNPELAMAYNNRGLIYFARGQKELAFASLSRSLQADPKYATAYNNRARFYYQTGQYELAWQDVQKVQSLGCRMDPPFIEALQQALAGEKQKSDGQVAEKKPPSKQSYSEKIGPLNSTINQILGFAGLVLWGELLLFFFAWKTLGRRSLKKPIKIPAEFGLERKDEFLAEKRTTLQAAIKHLQRFSKGVWFPITISCLALSVMGAFGWTGKGHLNFDGLLLAGVLIPGYGFNRLVIRMTKDSLKQLDEGECVLQTRSWAAGKPFWLLNLLPPLALMPLFYYIPLHELAHRLGFGLGVALAAISLSLVFIRAKAAIGLCVNLILISFVYLAFYLPSLDKIEKLKDLPFPDFFEQMFPPIVLPLVVVGAAVFLALFTLIKKPGVSVSSQYFKLALSKGPFFLVLLAPVLGSMAHKHKILPFSQAFVAVQALAWISVLISLLIKDYRKKVDFNEIRDYIVNRRELSIKLSRTYILIYLASFLAVCTAFETFRGLWFLWIAIIFWIGIILAYLWKFWRYAFVEPC
ncbi:MAG: tetratricopeptide repeat protein [Deltaproteobacteria bacterium]|nr:MAG: tetratricopeptide repeat protein [Deltaproteobacteria bacterium]